LETERRRPSEQRPYELHGEQQTIHRRRRWQCVICVHAKAVTSVRRKTVLEEIPLKYLLVIAASISMLGVEVIQADQIHTTPDGTIVVRAIVIFPDDSLPRLPFPILQNAWKGDGINFRADMRVTPEGLSELIARADKTVQRLYGSSALV